MLDTNSIRELREKRGLTLDQAAKAAGMNHRQSWFRLESGRRKKASLETVVAMARALGSGVDALLRFEPDKGGR